MDRGSADAGHHRLKHWLGCAALLAAMSPGVALAQDAPYVNPPGRVAQLNYFEGPVSFAPAGYAASYPKMVGAVMSVFWTLAALAPLLVVYARRPSLGGWTRAEALLVVAFFTALKGAVLHKGGQQTLRGDGATCRRGTRA